ncbi:Dabb family protein [Methanolobus sp. ZRKC3]|uniref:Dabb family protein n=1 Tax=Methanolobus sp. ZRKC3 TaxID=3125786 RepID=UPI0032434B1E
MLKHIVMWKIRDGAEGKDKVENIKKMKDMLESLKGKISEISEIEVGINVNSSDAAYDVVLYSVFEDEDALLTYQKHPEHVKVAEFVGPISEQRVVVDYIV